MNAFITRYATPLTTGLFAISAVSGVALFLHWAPGTFHAMHEWLSIALLVPFALHAWKNWAPLKNYAMRGTLVVPLVASLALAVPFAASGLVAGGGGNPAFRAIPMMTQARLSDLAPVLRTTPEALLAALAERGHAATSADETLDGIAAASGVRSAELLFAVMPTR